MKTWRKQFQLCDRWEVRLKELITNGWLYEVHTNTVRFCDSYNYSLGGSKVSFIKTKLFESRDLAGAIGESRNRIVRRPTRSYMCRTEA